MKAGKWMGRACRLALATAWATLAGCGDDDGEEAVTAVVVTNVAADTVVTNGVAVPDEPGAADGEDAVDEEAAGPLHVAGTWTGPVTSVRGQVARMELELRADADAIRGQYVLELEEPVQRLEVEPAGDHVFSIGSASGTLEGDHLVLTLNPDEWLTPDEVMDGRVNAAATEYTGSLWAGIHEEGTFRLTK